MVLEEYKKKRDFTQTKEPKGKKGSSTKRKLIFVIQKHRATRLHYDLRLEVDGVLKSWAVPKGPSLDPADKRLSIQVEDHPLDYANFEGIIPEGNYGAGEVIVWDQGYYSAVGADSDKETEKMMEEGLEKGGLHFILYGHKLKGTFSLVRFHGEKNEWLLIKKNDEFASTEDITEIDHSVLSNKTIEEIAMKGKSKKKLKKRAPHSY